MAWTSVTTLENDLPVGYTENDYYFTANRTGSRNRSAGAYPDITFILSFTPKDYLNSDAGDYYLIGDSQAGIFIRKTGSAGSTSGDITLKASYLGEADSGGTRPEKLGTCGVRSGYSAKWQIFSIICGIDEENHRGTIFGYQSWNDYPPRDSGAYSITYCSYGRYTNSEVAYNLIKNIMKSLYNFHSVPSLTGKGKEIILPQLISTDGKPVSNGSATDFSAFPTEAKVRTLANANI